jgi:SAM-dependent methyltransferase
VDLGALEGGWAVLLARAGYETVGIEGRANNLALCEYVRESSGLAWLSFVQDDVRNLAQYGTFDVCFCSGLLYHLDDPSAFLRLVAAQTSRVVVLHTHYAPETLDGSKYAPGLSDWDEHEGRRGRWFREWPEGSSPDEVESYRWASLENPRSFWLRKGDLMQAVADAGFPMVYEEHDFVGNMAHSTYQAEESRSLFFGVKPRFAAAA